MSYNVCVVRLVVCSVQCAFIKVTLYGLYILSWYSVHCVHCTTNLKLYSVHVLPVRGERMYTTQCALYTIQCTLLYTLYNIHCTSCTVCDKCTLYTI